jgi:hypothetical protein
MNHDCKQFAAELSKFVDDRISKAKLPTPDTTTLAAIIAAGPGEHQDRLFTLAVKKSVNQMFDGLIDEMKARHIMHKAQFHNNDTRESNISRDDLNSFLS